MNIKNLAIVLGLAGTSIVMTGSAYANNVITFNGEVVETTCEPVANNGDYSVILDQVSVANLSANAGQYTTVNTPFSIQVQNCPSTVTSVGAVLASNTYDASTGNLTDTTGYGHDSVQIQIMDGTTTTDQVVVGAANPVTYVTTTNNAASIPMNAYYYVKDTANVVAGQINTTATYAIRTQ